ncbi:MAG: SGNH/GDSL hydrolase family protein [Prolixibacteraceae bacterium]|nr:SGNH/GDSL hydrolase family protein [Prolixibacteraceae bacterium]
MKLVKTAFILILVLQIAACKGQAVTPEPISFPTAESLLSNKYITEGNLDRLNRAFDKAQKGGKLVIGALGGSITEGAASPTIDKRYANIVLAWWEKTFPKAQFELVNAGIGATGSDFGSMRVKRDLLSKSPDFVVVDYAVNDPNTREYVESYEGVIRQILNAPQKPSIVLLFMMKKDGTNAQEWQSKIGTHYSLPMVSYRDALWPEILAGRLRWEQISPDQVHPNEAGHVLNGELICMALERAYKKFNSENIQEVSSSIPEPLFTDSFEFTSLFDGEALVPQTNKGWAFDGSQQKSAGWKSSVPGSVLEFEISGKVIYLSCWRINGPMGKAGISVDGGTPVVMDAWFDQTWGGYRYMLPVGKNLLSGKHTVRIELLSEKNAQSTGNEFRVLCLGSAGIEK